MAETVWYRNVTQGTLHEVEKGSPLEKRLRREQREVYEEGDDEPTFEPAYERVSAADLKHAHANPASQPGYPAAVQARVAAAQAEKDRQKQRDEALDNILLTTAGAAPSEDEIQARIDAAVQAAVTAALAAPNQTTTPKGK